MVKEYKSLFLEVKDSYEEHAKGLLGTKLINEFIIKNHPEYFSITDPNKVEVDETGQNLKEYWFDILERDWNKKELLFPAEVKSTWGGDWNPDSKLKEAEIELKDHLRFVGGELKWKLPENAYALAIYITPEGEIYAVWRVHKVNELLER